MLNVSTTAGFGLAWIFGVLTGRHYRLRTQNPPEDLTRYAPARGRPRAPEQLDGRNADRAIAHNTCHTARRADGTPW